MTDALNAIAQTHRWSFAGKVLTVSVTAEFGHLQNVQPRQYRPLNIFGKNDVRRS